MDEKEYRSTLTEDELKERAFIVPFKMLNLDVWEQLNKYSAEFSKTYDQIINTALVRLFDDIEVVNRLRLKD